MEKFGFYLELEDVQYKYERLGSLISILQMFATEVIEIAGAPASCLSNALYEIEDEMEKTNERLKELIKQRERSDKQNPYQPL